MLITSEEAQDLQHLINAVGDTLLGGGKVPLSSGYILRIWRVDEIIKIEIQRENPLRDVEGENPPTVASSLSLRTGTGQTPRTRRLIEESIFPLLETLGVKNQKKAEALLQNRLAGTPILTFEALDFERAKAFLDFLGEWKLGGCNVRYEAQSWIVEYPPN